MSDKLERIGKGAFARRERRLATDYAKGSGLKGSVNFKDGKVYVAGKEMEDFTVDGDGKAHVDIDEMDTAIGEAKESMGIKENAYDNKISTALKDIEDIRAWSYEADKDPAYIAYRDQYMREGQRAYEDAFAQMTSLTGGYESSAAVTAGAQQLNYYNSQLNDKIPELMENAFDRYQDDVEQKYNYLGSLIDLDNAQTEKNNYIYDRYNDAHDADMERTIYEAYTRHKNALDLEGTAEENAFNKSKNEVDLAFAKDKNALDLEKERQEIDQAELGLDILEQTEDIRSVQIKNAIETASVRGYFTDEEAKILGIKKDSNGQYPSPFSGEVKKQLELWNSVGKPETKYKTDEAIRKAWNS